MPRLEMEVSTSLSSKPTSIPSPRRVVSSEKRFASTSAESIGYDVDRTTQYPIQRRGSTKSQIPRPSSHYTQKNDTLSRKTSSASTVNSKSTVKPVMSQSSSSTSFSRTIKTKIQQAFGSSHSDTSASKTNPSGKNVEKTQIASLKEPSSPRRSTASARTESITAPSQRKRSASDSRATPKAGTDVLHAPLQHPAITETRKVYDINPRGDGSSLNASGALLDTPEQLKRMPPILYEEESERSSPLEERNISSETETSGVESSFLTTEAPTSTSETSSPLAYRSMSEPLIRRRNSNRVPVPHINLDDIDNDGDSDLSYDQPQSRPLVKSSTEHDLNSILYPPGTVPPVAVQEQLREEDTSSPYLKEYEYSNIQEMLMDPSYNTSGQSAPLPFTVQKIVPPYASSSHVPAIDSIQEESEEENLMDTSPPALYSDQFDSAGTDARTSLHTSLTSTNATSSANLLSSEMGGVVEPESPLEDVTHEKMVLESVGSGSNPYPSPFMMKKRSLTKVVEEREEEEGEDTTVDATAPYAESREPAGLDSDNELEYLSHAPVSSSRYLQPSNMIGGYPQDTWSGSEISLVQKNSRSSIDVKPPDTPQSNPWSSSGFELDHVYQRITDYVGSAGRGSSINDTSIVDMDASEGVSDVDIEGIINKRNSSSMLSPTLYASKQASKAIALSSTSIVSDSAPEEASQIHPNPATVDHSGINQAIPTPGQSIQGFTGAVPPASSQFNGTQVMSTRESALQQQPSADGSAIAVSDTAGTDKQEPINLSDEAEEDATEIARDASLSSGMAQQKLSDTTCSSHAQPNPSRLSPSSFSRDVVSSSSFARDTAPGPARDAATTPSMHLRDKYRSIDSMQSESAVSELTPSEEEEGWETAGTSVVRSGAGAPHTSTKFIAAPVYRGTHAHTSASQPRQVSDASYSSASTIRGDLRRSHHRHSQSEILASSWYPATPGRYDPTGDTSDASDFTSVRQAPLGSRRRDLVAHPLTYTGAPLNIHEIKSMDKLELFFAYTSMRADKEKAEAERSALYDALRELRETLDDVRRQRSDYKKRVAELRWENETLRQRVEDRLSDDRLVTEEKRTKSRSTKATPHHHAPPADSKYDDLKRELEQLKQDLSETRQKESKLEQENVLFKSKLSLADHRMHQMAEQARASDAARKHRYRHSLALDSSGHHGSQTAAQTATQGGAYLADDTSTRSYVISPTLARSSTTTGVLPSPAVTRLDELLEGEQAALHALRQKSPHFPSRFDPAFYPHPRDASGISVVTASSMSSDYPDYLPPRTRKRSDEEELKLDEGDDVFLSQLSAERSPVF